MKIAVTYDNGEVFQHFGHTEQFKVYEVEAGKVTLKWLQRMEPDMMHWQLLLQDWELMLFFVAGSEMAQIMHFQKLGLK